MSWSYFRLIIAAALLVAAVASGMLVYDIETADHSTWNTTFSSEAEERVVFPVDYALELEQNGTAYDITAGVPHLVATELFDGHPLHIHEPTDNITLVVNESAEIDLGDQVATVTLVEYDPGEWPLAAIGISEPDTDEPVDRRLHIEFEEPVLDGTRVPLINGHDISFKWLLITFVAAMGSLFLKLFIREVAG